MGHVSRFRPGTRRPPRANRAHIFERFFGEAEGAHHTGAGLGLAIVAENPYALMAARFEVDQAIGGGALFYP